MAVVQPGEAAPQWEIVAGMPCWIELVTTDVDQAREFYAELFGWQYETHQDDEAGEHVVAYRDGFPVASIRRSAGEHSEWRLFLAAQDVDAVAEQARGEGCLLYTSDAADE